MTYTINGFDVQIATRPRVLDLDGPISATIATIQACARLDGDRHARGLAPEHARDLDVVIGALDPPLARAVARERARHFARGYAAGQKRREALT